MKKFLVLLLVISFTFLFTACDIKLPLYEFLESKKALNQKEQELFEKKEELSIIQDDFIKEQLIDGYWENDIQSRYIYKFFEDGTVYSYCYNSNDSLSEAELQSYLSEKGTYTLKDGKLTISLAYVGSSDISFTATASWVCINDDCNWEIGHKDFLPKDEYFFYESDWYDDGSPSCNAFYLLKLKDTIL